MRNETPAAKREFAKSLRRNATEAERKLWSLLRGKRFEGYKFKRQVPLDGYVADFVCFEAKVIVEADGSQHMESEHDRLRDQHFIDAGFVTVRLWNPDILHHPEGVAALILEALRRKL